MKMEKKEIYTRKEVCEMLKDMQIETLKCNGFFAGHITQTWAVDRMIGERIRALGGRGVHKEHNADTGATEYSWDMEEEVERKAECTNRYDDVFIFVPETQEIIRISEGSGDNLLPEDTAEGYVDYIYYDQYELSNGLPEVDGGQVLLKDMFRDKYGCTADSIPEVLNMAYGNCELDYKILNGKEEGHENY